MSRPARWDMATGRLYRQAAALSGKEIRACVRIAAGACPGVHQLGKGFVKDAFPGFYASSWSSSQRLRPPPYRGANAPILSHFACGGPSLGHPQSGDRSSSSPPRELTGRQPIQDALRHGVQLLKPTHRIFLRSVYSRRPTSARTSLRDPEPATSRPPIVSEDRRLPWTKSASQRVEKCRPQVM